MLSRFTWFATCVSLFLFAGEILADNAQSLDGVWLPTTMEVGGKMFPDELRNTIKLTIDGDSYTVTAGKHIDKGTVKHDSTATPKTMDIVGVEGPNKGKTILAIYEFDGQTLRICYDIGGEARPMEFKTIEGKLLFLATYQREKQ